MKCTRLGEVAGEAAACSHQRARKARCTTLHCETQISTFCWQRSEIKPSQSTPHNITLPQHSYLLVVNEQLYLNPACPPITHICCLKYPLFWYLIFNCYNYNKHHVFNQTDLLFLIVFPHSACLELRARSVISVQIFFKRFQPLPSKGLQSIWTPVVLFTSLK